MIFESEAIEKREMTNAGQTKDMHEGEAENTQELFVQSTGERAERSPSLSIRFNHEPRRGKTIRFDQEMLPVGEGFQADAEVVKDLVSRGVSDDAEVKSIFDEN